MRTQANLAIAPLQDFLGLDTLARMNTPGVTDGNWRWRFQWDMLNDGLAPRIKKMVEESGRQNAG
jgi:4-alpha-glucanotransferase